jgi:hypothetical protein
MGTGMAGNKRILTLAVVLLSAMLILGGLIWVNVQFSRNNPGGNDFLAHYVGTRSLLLEGKSPYSDEVALEIQRRVFGRPAEPGEIEHRVVYPLYSILIFAPFALINNYAIARVAWMTAMEIALLGTGYLALKITNWKPKLIILAVYYQFAVLWYHGFRAVINGNAVIVVGFFITGSLYALSKKNDIGAGILLALSTIKPNIVILYIFCILVWCAYQKRYLIIAWFFGSLLFLTVGGMLLIPDWITQNLWEILRYPGYNPPGSIGEVIGIWLPEFSGIIRAGIGVGLGLLLIFEIWDARRGKFEHILWAACLALVISQWIGIPTDPGNFVILFTPFVMVLARLEERWKERSTYYIVAILGLTLFGLWALFVTTLNYEYQPMQNSIMFFPFPGMILIGLYWIKWWVIGGSTALRQETL